MSSTRLRALRAEDLQARTGWLRHEQSQGTMPLTGEFDDERSRAWFARIQANRSRSDVVLEAEGQPVAAGGLTGISHEVGLCELYALVSPAARGKGYGRLLVVGLCDLAFTRLGLNRVFLWTYGTNTPARRLYEGCGFRQEGSLREHALVKGARVDRVAMGILHREWASAPIGRDRAPQLDHSLGMEPQR